MGETIFLIGSEDVYRAGCLINQAAESMQSIAGSLSFTLEQHQRFMDDWLQRFEIVVDKLK